MIVKLLLALPVLCVLIFIVLQVMLRTVYRKTDVFLYQNEPQAWDPLFVRVAKAIGIAGPVILTLNVARPEDKQGFGLEAEAAGLPLEVAMARFIAASARARSDGATRLKKHKAARQYQSVSEAAEAYADRLLSESAADAR